MAWFNVSQSKVKCWRQCRQRYWFRYVEKLRRKLVPRPLRFGRMVHEMIEAEANGKDPQKHLAKVAKRDDQMFRSQREEYGNIVEDVRIIMSEYFNYWAGQKDKQVEYLRYDAKSSEISFEYEVKEHKLVVNGKIDNIARRKQGKTKWLAEHKSGKSIPNEDHRWRQLQPALYIRISQRLGLGNLEGTLWDYIRSKSPSIPKLLKTGKPSARALDTLPLAVEGFLESIGKNPSDRRYAPLMKVAEQNRRTYFQRIFSPVSEQVVDFLYDDFIRSAVEMSQMHGDENRVSMTIERHCDWCEYEPLCRAKMQDLDIDFLKKKDYVIAPKYEREEPDFEG